MKMYYVWILLIICHHSASKFATDDDEILYDIGKLYQETNYELDPHDMLAPRKINTNFHSNKKLDSNDDDSTIKLNVCQQKIHQLEIQLKNEQLKYKTLESKFKEEATVDMSSYYARVVQHFWSTLQMDEVSRRIGEGEHFIQAISVKVSLSDIDLFKSYMKKKSSPYKIDEFFEKSFEVIPFPDESNLASNLFSYFEEVPKNFKNIDLWINLMCAIVICLGMWAMVLFIRDIQRELRWKRVISMMCILVFIICCLWHWRHMHKVADSKRHAKLMKRGFVDIPEDCKQGYYGEEGWLQYSMRKMFGGRDTCEAYYEEMMVSKEDEITPSMVIAETLAKFILQPLQHLGSESAKFIVNFYEHIPIAFQIPATMFFITILVIVLFVLFGYGIDFPFWLGGIRPMPVEVNRSNSSEEEESKMERMLKDQELFMEKSKAVLTDIASACMEHKSNQKLTEPVMEAAMSLINRQLTDLISQQLEQFTPSKNGKAAIDPDISVDVRDSSVATNGFPSIKYKCDPGYITPKKQKNLDDSRSESNSGNMSYSDLGAFFKVENYRRNDEFVSQVKDVINNSLDNSKNESFIEKYASPLSKSVDTNKGYDFSDEIVDDPFARRRNRSKRKMYDLECSPKSEKFINQVKYVLES